MVRNCGFHHLLDEKYVYIYIFMFFRNLWNRAMWNTLGWANWHWKDIVLNHPISLILAHFLQTFNMVVFCLKGRPKNLQKQDSNILFQREGALIIGDQTKQIMVMSNALFWGGNEGQWSWCIKCWPGGWKKFFVCFFSPEFQNNCHYNSNDIHSLPRLLPQMSPSRPIRCQEQKLEEFGSDFPAMLRWFKSSQLDFKSAISWLGTVSNFRCLGVKFIKFEYV